MSAEQILIWPARALVGLLAGMGVWYFLDAKGFLQMVGIVVAFGLLLWIGILIIKRLEFLIELDNIDQRIDDWMEH